MNSGVIERSGPMDRDSSSLLPANRVAVTPSRVNWFPWLAIGTAIAGLVATSNRELSSMGTFVLLGYAVAAIAVIRAIKQTHDPFNPLTILLAVVAIRFSLPALILLLKGYWTPGYELFEAMRLREDEWMFGHALAVLGTVGLVLGWTLRSPAPGRADPARVVTMPSGIWIVSTAGALLGLGALLVFVQTNVGGQGLAETIGQGSFRGVVVQQGTGKFFLLSLLLIASSVLLTSYLISTGRPVRSSLMPVLLAAAAFFFLGGRARAGTPLAAGFLLVWYSIDKTTLRRSMGRGLKWIGAGAFLFIWIAAFGQLYRGGGGLSAIGQSFSEIPSYVEYGALIDYGQLHALAAASRIEPGVLGGATFENALLWPISDIIGWGAENPGALLIRETLGPQPRTWGLHSAIIGDSYLNFGLIGVVAVSALFGFTLRSAYSRFRTGRMLPALYALAIIYATRLYFEGITKWPELLVIVVFSLILARGSSLFSPETERRSAGTGLTMDNDPVSSPAGPQERSV